MRKAKHGRRTVVDHVEETNWQFTMARLMQMVGIPAIMAMAVLVWTGVSDLKDAMAELKTTVAVLETQVKAGSDDRYRATNARADFLLRDQKIDDITRRIQNLETMLDTERTERKHDDRLRGGLQQ